MQAQPYIGNPDYRGYLNYLGQNGDQRASTLLNYVGNDGVWGQSGVPLNTSTINDLKNYNDATYMRYRTQGAVDGGATTGGAGTSTNNSLNAGFVNQAYDTKIAGLQGIMDTFNPQQDAANLNVQNQFQNQSNTLQSQKAIGERNLGIAGEQVQSGKVKGIADLNRQVETMGRSYANQLGAYGAGDSSASGMINQALSGMASRNRSDLLSNAGQQQRSIDLQGQDLQVEFGNNMKSLEDWKATSLNDIATKFLQQRQAIQQQMTGANADRAQALAQLDANYVNQAITQLAALENQYRDGAAQLVAQYQNIQAPSVGINPQLQQFAVNPISAGRISQLSVAPSVSAGNQPLAVGQRRPFEEDYGFGL